MSFAEDMRGHNQPPLNELLAEETTKLSVRSFDLLNAASRAHVADDDTAGKTVVLYKMLREHKNAIEAVRIERKQPFLESGRIVDRHFGTLTEPLDAMLSVLNGMLDRYRRKKEQEAIVTGTVTEPINSGLGVKAHARKVWRVEIRDYGLALNHCCRIAQSAINETIQGIYERQVKAGVRELPGATITEDSTTVVR